MVKCLLWTSITERHECRMDTKIYFAYFTFFAHASQYFSTKITPSPTLNKASWVALRPQVTQNFGFELVLSSNDLRCIKFFCIFKSFPHKLWWNCCCNSSICHSFVNIPTIYIRTCLLSLLLFNSSLLEEGKNPIEFAVKLDLRSGEVTRLYDALPCWLSNSESS